MPIGTPYVEVRNKFDVLRARTRIVVVQPCEIQHRPHKGGLRPPFLHNGVSAGGNELFIYLDIEMAPMVIGAWRHTFVRH